MASILIEKQNLIQLGYIDEYINEKEAINAVKERCSPEDDFCDFLELHGSKHQLYGIICLDYKREKLYLTNNSEFISADVPGLSMPLITELGGVSSMLLKVKNYSLDNVFYPIDLLYNIKENIGLLKVNKVFTILNPKNGSLTKFIVISEDIFRKKWLFVSKTVSIPKIVFDIFSLR